MPCKNHLSSCLKSSQFCRHRTSVVSVFVIQFLTSAFRTGHLTVCLQKEHLFFDLFLSCPLNLCIMFTVGSGLKCLEGILLPCCFVYFTLFNLRPTVHDVFVFYIFIFSKFLSVRVAEHPALIRY